MDNYSPAPLSNFVSAECATRLAELRSVFANATPFKYVVIDDFLRAEVAEAMLREFPSFDVKAAINEHGHLGGKATQAGIASMGGVYKQVDKQISSREFRDFVGQIVGIDDLIYDPHYFGGGTHENRNGQELDPHVDFNYQQGTNFHRRLNLIVYLNKDWKREWGGQIEIHSDPRRPEKNVIKGFDPIFNRCIIFETNEYSWHGFPKITLPSALQHCSRKSFAIYYYSKQRPSSEIAPPHGTFYVQRPLPTEVLEKLPAEARPAVLISLKRRDDWIQFYQKKELEWKQQLVESSSLIEQLRSCLPPSLKGPISFIKPSKGLHPDGWLGEQFECGLLADRSLARLTLSFYVPLNRQDVFDAITHISVNGTPRPVLKEIDHDVSVEFHAEFGANLQIVVLFVGAKTPQELGDGADERRLSLVLKHISAN